MPWPKTGATQYHGQLGLSEKGCAIKGLVVCNDQGSGIGHVANNYLRPILLLPK